jgi:hypothetical protein
MRLWLGISIGAAVFVATALVLSIPIAFSSYNLVSWLFPESLDMNANTTLDRTLLRAFSSLLLAALAGLLAAAFIADPKVSRRTEAILLVAACIVLSGVSGVNFWVRDSLINIYAQLLIDLALILVSLPVVAMIWSWRPERPFARSVRIMAVYLVTIAGLILPGYYGTIFLLRGMGASGVGLKSIGEFLDVIASAAAAVVALIAWYNGKQEAS